MTAQELSTCFCTNDVSACKDFYHKHFGATPEFDCGWYVSIRLPSGGPSLQFIQPQSGMTPFSGVGVTLNFKVGDVDSEHQRLTALGLAVAMPLDDHPWGDRGFAVTDPIGISLYIFSEREPSAEFKPFVIPRAS